MNTHEAERIAGALHIARPDWPLQQLKTLLTNPSLAARPRRDVFVALAWVACETATSSPYRVLESGPWWRAAAVEGSSVVLRRGPWCSTCGQPRPESGGKCVGHEWEPPADRKRAPDAMAAIVEDAKQRKAPTVAPPVPVEVPPDPRADAARAALTPNPAAATRAALHTTKEEVDA